MQLWNFVTSRSTMIDLQNPSASHSLAYQQIKGHSFKWYCFVTHRRLHASISNTNIYWTNNMSPKNVHGKKLQQFTTRAHLQLMVFMHLHMIPTI